MPVQITCACAVAGMTSPASINENQIMDEKRRILIPFRIVSLLSSETRIGILRD